MESLAAQLHVVAENDPKPMLPPELERIIFEMAVEDLVHNLPPTYCALNLQLTARRVRSWIRPLLYRMLKATTHAPKNVFPNFEKYEALKIEEIGPFIKYFIYDVYRSSQSHLLHTLRHCPNIEDLAIWWDANKMGQIYPAISSLKHVKRLYSGLGGLTIEQIQESPIFQNVTHLDLLGLPPKHLLQELKNLTHFGTNTAFRFDEGHSLLRKVQSVLDLILAIPQLQVAKVLHDSSPDAVAVNIDFKDI
ncbi:hypothetical protein CVT24_011761 [Panaeolus cyanescens]|uniref:F-box domain-containing protein n=1 Tax=Panaeolus cyanescens TaxID=181874 RepID=A0A409YNK9_9AGAR|nr:hypothetical protein CVT24_011761 [Panaeolus cyanescens]